MKKIFTLLGVSFGLWVSAASADDLKNSLTSILNEKESPSMVDLGNINLNKPIRPKTRSGETILVTVNGQKILKKDADNYLKQRTQGKVTDFDKLAPDQRSRLLQELALPVVVLDTAKKELSEIEKQAVYTRAWMQKEARKINITDEQTLTVYNQLKQQSKDNNATREIPPFETIKDKLKLQILEKTLIEKLMKDAKIEVM